jgi:hypothetical protein
MEGVERLCLVSKVLFDSRLCELKRENEELRAKVVRLEQRMQRRRRITDGIFTLLHARLSASCSSPASEGPGGGSSGAWP